MYSPWDVLLHLSVFAFPLHDIGYQVCQNAKTNCVTIKKRIFNEAMVKMHVYVIYEKLTDNNISYVYIRCTIMDVSWQKADHLFQCLICYIMQIRLCTHVSGYSILHDNRSLWRLNTFRMLMCAIYIIRLLLSGTKHISFIA